MKTYTAFNLDHNGQNHGTVKFQFIAFIEILKNVIVTQEQTLA